MRSPEHSAGETGGYEEVLELMHGHWDCFEAAARGEELFALELALRAGPNGEPDRPRPPAR